MASSGTINGSWNGSSTASISLRVDWSVVSQDIANKTSKVKFKWIAQRSSSQRTTNKANAPWSQSTAGASSSGTVNFDIRNTALNTDYNFLTTTKTIQHEPNGTKTAAVSGSIDLTGTSAGTGSWSSNITLPTIAVIPPTADSLTIGDAGQSIGAGVFVATKSIFTLTATATAYDGATVANYAFYSNGVLLQSSASATYTAPAPATAGSYTFKVVVTDSNGLTGELTESAVTVYAYELPSITNTVTFRSDSGGTASASGTYASAEATWTKADCGGHNTATGTATVNSLTATLTSGTPSVIGNGTLTPSSAWEITYVVTDAFGETASASAIIYSQFKNFGLYPDDTVGGFAFGESPQQGRGIFNVPDVLFRGDVTHDGDLQANGAVTVNATEPKIQLQDEGTALADIGHSSGRLALREYGANGTNYEDYELPAPGAITANAAHSIITTKPTDAWTGSWSSSFTTCPCFSSMTAGSAIDIEWTQYGKLVCAVFKVSRAAATAAGSNVFSANIRNDATYGNYLPAVTVCSAGYYSSSGVIAKYDTNGTFTCRVIGAQLAASNTVQIGMTFMLA